jgi:hypothetical protein
MPRPARHEATEVRLIEGIDCSPRQIDGLATLRQSGSPGHVDFAQRDIGTPATAGEIKHMQSMWIRL